MPSFIEQNILKRTFYDQKEKPTTTTTPTIDKSKTIFKKTVSNRNRRIFLYFLRKKSLTENEYIEACQSVVEKNGEKLKGLYKHQ